MSDIRPRFTIDSIDVNADGEDVATLVSDDGEVIVVALSILPSDARRGDVLTIDLTHDAEETAARRQRVRDLQKRLFG
jgi:hypothetical protein